MNLTLRASRSMSSTFHPTSVHARPWALSRLLAHHSLRVKAAKGRLFPMIASISWKGRTIRLAKRALRSRYLLNGLYLLPTLRGDTFLLAQFKQMRAPSSSNNMQLKQYILLHLGQRLRSELRKILLQREHSSLSNSTLNAQVYLTFGAQLTLRICDLLQE